MPFNGSNLLSNQVGLICLALRKAAQSLLPTSHNASKSTPCARVAFMHCPPNDYRLHLDLMVCFESHRYTSEDEDEIETT